MRPIDFLVLADELLRSRPIPAGHRTSISRAYYAAHHHIKAFLERVGVTVKTGPESHSDVWSHLAHIDDVELERVGSDLCDLRDDRNRADYDLDDARPERANNAKLVVEQVQGLISDIDSCEKDPPRYGKVKAAILARHRLLRGTK